MAQRELPEVSHADAVVPALAGTALWSVALLVSLALGADDTWVAVCAVGIGLGFLGSGIALKRRANYRRAGKSAAGQG